jgi:prepilin-type N-terminal cleavage/methylation domain-containing protein
MQRKKRIIRRHLTGFSLAEVMVVIAVIATLTIASMQYYSYEQAKAQAISGYKMAQNVKANIDAAFDESTATPKELPASGYDYAANPSHTVASVAYTLVNQANHLSTIVVTFSNNAQKSVAGKTLTLTSAQSGSYLAWTCTTTLSGGRFDGNAIPANNNNRAILLDDYCEVQ